MTFEWPHILWLLLAPAALLAREMSTRRGPVSARHPNILRAEAGMHSLALEAASTARPAAGRRPRWWLCAGLALAVTALARPQWGQIEEPVYNESHQIVLAMDLSRSMLAQDVAPSRLEREKLLARSLLDKLEGERVGLVIFSGTAFLQSPLTSDYEILREFLPPLNPDFMPVGGTDYGAMIDAAAGAFDASGDGDRYLILLSDGGANDTGWRDHVRALKDKGVRVIALGIGTRAGGFIPDGSGGFMKDHQGAVVLAKLESSALQELAHRTGGIYRDAGSWVDLPDLLKSTIDAGRKGRFVEKVSPRYIERFQWLLAPALLCLLMSFWREFPVRPKPRDVLLASRTAILLILGWGAFAIAARAQETAPPHPDSSALLGRIVSRISAEDRPSPSDWAELGNQTVSWGHGLQAAHETVPAGPVHDALAGVNTGAALDPKAADWPGLRSELQSLMKKPEERKQNKNTNKKQNQNSNSNQNQNESQNQEQKQNPNENKNSNQNKSQKQDQNQARQNSGSPHQQRPEKDQQQQPRSQSSQEKDSSLAENKPEHARPSGAMQRIGGSPQRPSRDPANANPELAVPLQKLAQVKNQDSPAELYRMIQNHEPRARAADNSDNW